MFSDKLSVKDIQSLIYEEMKEYIFKANKLGSVRFIR